jgi:hypothetical protein
VLKGAGWNHSGQTAVVRVGGVKDPFVSVKGCSGKQEKAKISLGQLFKLLHSLGFMM